MIVDLLLDGAAVAHLLAVALLLVFVGSFGVTLAIYLLKRHDAPSLPEVADANLLSVTVQLPVYNEAHVIARLIDACARLDYPPDKLRIQVIDDSTDETTAIARRRISAWRAQGVAITLLRRPDRAGYKAGALAYGLERADNGVVCVFDADFVPPRDFLRRTMPHFNADDRLALVQTRWEHLNPAQSGLTRAQSLTMDAHFVVEQTARSRGNLPMSMNGTGGLWRVAALRDAGGWSAATLTEDLDLSYRALLRGWRFLYLPDVAVPGELPPQIQAYKLQQRRWATGVTECLIRHAIPLLRSRRYGALQKFMGLVQLSQYAVQPVFLLVFLLTPILLWGNRFANMPNLGALFGVVGAIPPAIMITAQMELRRPRRLLSVPVQTLFGMSMVLNNTLGVLAAPHRPDMAREFKRTPKFSDTRWSSSRYALRIDPATWGEIALGVYAAWGSALALSKLPALAPYMASYAVSFLGLAVWNMVQARQISRQPLSISRQLKRRRGAMS